MARLRRDFCLWLVVFIAILVHMVLAHGGHQENPLHDSKIIQDKEHIKEHLKDEIDIKDENLKDEDLQFHYFKLHDYDNNNMLDGIELMKAMSHYHDEEASNSNNTAPVQYTEDQMASMIDQILSEDDTNNDGYIDYPEFVASQKSS